jgi:hypothetical protein
MLSMQLLMPRELHGKPSLKQRLTASMLPPLSSVLHLLHFPLLSFPPGTMLPMTQLASSVTPLQIVLQIWIKL